MIASPCNKVCVMDAGQRYCLGCKRTLDEIARWSEMSDAERAAVLARLAARPGKQGMRRLTWYFDFVSPYSYIAFKRLHELPRDVAVELRPVLFAGLLNHFGQKGPAELPAKRRWTYRWCTWWAKSLGIPFRFPASHPFNPLQHLRLAIAAGATPRNVGRIFDAVWTSGAEASDPGAFAALARELGVEEARLGAPEVKDALRKNTEDAAARGVFGVPTYEVDGEIFWGADSIAFVNAFLADPAALRNDEIRRADALPVGATRKG